MLPARVANQCQGNHSYLCRGHIVTAVPTDGWDRDCPHQHRLLLFETLMNKGNISSSCWQVRQSGKHIPMGWQLACLLITWWQTGH